MKQQVKRLELSGDTYEEFSFDKKCGKYLVKNFSENPIYVSFDNTVTDNEAIKIESGSFQVVIANEYLGGLDYYRTNKIYVKGTGEVEVQQLCFN